MVYTNNVPQGNQQIAATQQPILNNFAFLNTGLAVEHNFNAAGSGTDMYHLKASMPNLSADPATPPAGTNGMYYVRGGEAKFINSSNTICQLTLGSPVAQGFQWIAGVLLQWGTLNPNVNTVVTFPIAFSTSVFNIQLTGTNVGNSTFRASVASGSVGLGGFTFGGSVDANWTPIYWMAIGK